MKNKKNGNERKGKQSTRPECNSKAARRLAEKEWMRQAMARMAAEEWWRNSLPGQKALAMTLGHMMEEMTERKRIEVRLESGVVRVRFIHILQQPEKGCLNAIVLPERASGGWN